MLSTKEFSRFEAFSACLKPKKQKNRNAGNIKSNRYGAFVTKVILNYEVFHYQSCACSKSQSSVNWENFCISKQTKTVSYEP